MRPKLSYLSRTILTSCCALLAIGARPAGAISWSNPHHAYVLIAGFNAADDYVAEISVDKKPSETRKLAGSRAHFCQVDALAIGPQGNLYISGYFGKDCLNSVPGIEIFAAGAHGNASPIATISGRRTLMDAPYGMAFDGSGNLYVVEQHGGPMENGSVNVYAPGASGNVAPTARIIGPNTLFAAIYWVALDETGEIFVGQDAGAGSQILKYAPGARGDAAPIENVSVEPYGNGFNELQISGNTVYVSVGIVREQTPTMYELSTSDLSQTGSLSNPRFTQIFGDVDTAGNLHVENVHRTRGLGCGISRFYEFGAGQSQPSRIRPTGTNCGGGYTVDGP